MTWLVDLKSDDLDPALHMFRARVLDNELTAGHWGFVGMIFFSLFTMSMMRVLYNAMRSNGTLGETCGLPPSIKVRIDQNWRKEMVEDLEKGDMADDVEAQCEVKFSPPLYIQRYDVVIDVIQRYHEKGFEFYKLLDVGCAECKFVKRAIQIPFLEKIFGLDLDRRLVTSGFVLQSLQPLTTDYLNKRQRDLEVKLFAGSIAERDPETLGTDVVTAIEVIEHLEESVLRSFEATVFSYIKPKLVIVTTPNSEFNVVFPNFSGMRHWDHKFEWTRTEFQVWSYQLGEKYGYTVQFDGIGAPPPSYPEVGYCSQMAVFLRRDLQSTKLPPPCDRITFVNKPPSSSYEQVFYTVYPGHYLTQQQILENEILYTVTHESHIYIRENDIADLSRTEIPIAHLLSCSRTTKSSLTFVEFREQLKKLDYTISENGVNIVLNMEDSSPSTTTDYSSGDGEQVDNTVYNTTPLSEEFWDED